MPALILAIKPELLFVRLVIIPKLVMAPSSGGGLASTPSPMKPLFVSLPISPKFVIPVLTPVIMPELLFVRLVIMP